MPFQTAYFEIPFYMFLIVIASVLFSWQEAYEMYYVQCQEEEGENDQGAQSLGFSSGQVTGSDRAAHGARESIVSLDN